MKKVHVLFLPNGNTAVYENIGQNSEQVPELQKPWLIKFAEFLEKNNVDVINSTFELPDFGNIEKWKKVKLIKTEDEYNWNIEGRV